MTKQKQQVTNSKQNKNRH